LKPVLSSMSLSTMASDDCEEMVSDGQAQEQGMLRSVASNCSVSSMESNVWESLDAGADGDFLPAHQHAQQFAQPGVQVQLVPQPLHLLQPLHLVQPMRTVPQVAQLAQFQGQAGPCEVRSRRGGVARGSPSPAVPLSRSFTHSQVPKHANLVEQFSQDAAEAPQTTMMVRNIPNRYTQSDLMEELESLGFAGTFDFLYAPTDFGTMGNVGYFFINFITPEWATRCRMELDGYVFTRHQKKTAKKVATVSIAHLQGLQANIRHYEKSAVAARARTKGCGPVIMPSLSSLV